jgi:hypothetical protein
MKAYLGALILISSVSAFAQIRQDECPRPGLIQSKMIGQTGELVSMSHNRQGSMDIPDSFRISGALRTKVFNNFVDKMCVAKAYVTNENICQPISVEVALGQGNNLFRSLYNLGETTLNRAQLIVQNLSYSVGRPSSERLDAALQILSNLTRLAATRGLPHSWLEFKDTLDQGLKDGYLTFQIVDEITNIYVEANKRALGFVPMEGARINQGVGNGRLNTLFDLGLSRDARATRIQNLIMGVSYSEALALSSAFITFAANNGIPSNWDQFALMIKSAVTASSVSPAVENAILVAYEMPNRKALGFELSAELCRMTDVKRVVNVVEVMNRSEIAKTTNQPYEITLASGPLVQGESESLSLSTDGMRQLDLRISSSVNKYQVNGSEVNGVMKFTVTGQRLAVRPPNNLKIKFNKMGSTLNVRIQNKSFNPKVGGRVMVKVEYINQKFLDSKVIATEIYELNGATELVRNADARSDKVDKVKAYIQIVGSPYYSAEFSKDSASDKD